MEKLTLKEKEHMKLSIIIPAYNASGTIERCLNSIINQDVKDMQIIIIDDYSSDSTFLCCEKLQKKFSCIELYRSDGRGVSDARNTGLKYADGDIIGFCDADDYFEKNVFSIILKEFQSDEGLGLYCLGFYIRTLDGKIKRSCRIPRQYVSAEKMFDKFLCDDRVMGSVCNKFYRAEIAKGVRFHKELDYCEDTAYNAEILLKNKHLKCLINSECVYNYVQNPDSATNDISMIFDDDNVLKYNKSMYYIRKKTRTEFEKRCVDRAIYRLSVGAYFFCEPNREQKHILLQEVRRLFCLNLLYCWKDNVIRNVKFIIKGIIIIIDNGTDRILGMVKGTFCN